MMPQPFAIPGDLAGQGPVVFAMGTFDGIHLGHQAVLAATRQLAGRLGAMPAVLFFDPSPKVLFAPENAAALLTPEAKTTLLNERYGMAAVVRLAFTRELAALTPEQFLDTFFFHAAGLRTAGFVVGEDWRFGRGNCGDAALLATLAARHGAKVTAVPQLRTPEDGQVISSTRIRHAIAGGDCAGASRLLGRPYTLDGQVETGQHIATSRLDCPTANIAGEGLQLPPYGVYAARTRIDGAEGAPLPGIVYIGDAPTLRGVGARPVIELHLFGFDGGLYGRRLQVEPVRFLRPSIVFPTTEALREQIARDMADAANALALQPPSSSAFPKSLPLKQP